MAKLESTRIIFVRLLFCKCDTHRNFYIPHLFSNGKLLSALEVNDILSSLSVLLNRVSLWYFTEKVSSRLWVMTHILQHQPAPNASTWPIFALKTLPSLRSQLNNAWWLLLFWQDHFTRTFSSLWVLSLFALQSCWRDACLLMNSPHSSTLWQSRTQVRGELIQSLRLQIWPSQTREGDSKELASQLDKTLLLSALCLVLS